MSSHTSILNPSSDAVHWYMSEMSARVVSETGIPSDRHHLGKLILRGLRDAPDFVMQIDGATGKSETFQSVLERSVRCASSFRKLGLQVGDNIVLMAPNHLDLTIPFYAALYLGIGIAALDAYLGVLELEQTFKINEAKIVFCQNERAPFIKEALKNVNLDATVITFDESNDCITFPDFLIKYGEDADVENFRAADFDPAETISLLLSTSGTTGLPKAASLTHKNFALSLPLLWSFSFSKFPTPSRLVIIVSPLQWLSAGFHFLFSPILRFTRLQSSSPVTEEHFIELVNKYRPSYMICSPTMMTTFTKPENVEKYDFTCFEYIIVGGSAVHLELLQNIRKISPKTELNALYGLSEVGGLVFFDKNPPLGSMGRPQGLFEYRLVDPETKMDVVEPHKNGELWLRGPSVSKGYYNSPEATKEAFLEDGWFRTGDIFYRDENFFFFFVERLKLLLKYRNHQISTLELESVIRKHPGVVDVAVTGIPHHEFGDLPVACVVTNSEHTVTAQEIKDLVKNSLTDTKHLRGGVIFLKELPMSASTKLDRRKLKEMVLTMERE